MTDSVDRFKPRHAHWDCFAGASCDSMLAACMDAFQDPESAEDALFIALEDVVIDRTAFRGCTSAIVRRYGFSARQIDDFDMAPVVQPNDENYQTDFHWDPANIPAEIRGAAAKIFSEYTSAQAQVQGKAIKEIDLDADEITKVFGVLLLLNRLNVKTVSCGPLPLGQGTISAKDGSLLPVPSPLTLQLLLGMHTCPGPRAIVDAELVTPAAAAILRVLATSSTPGAMPAGFRPIQIGMGAGSEDSPICTRIMIGTVENECVPSPIQLPSSVIPVTGKLWNMDTMAMLETNLDDMTAEALAFAVELLLDKGSADAWITPIVMKKGRSAHTLHCLCRSEKENELLELLFRHTTTLGVRIRRGVSRAALKRDILSVQTPYKEDNARQGLVNVKVGYLGDEVVSIKAEFDHCRTISLETGTPLKDISDAAVQAAKQELGD